MLVLIFLICIICIVQTDSFKLPDVNFDTDVSNIHDQISESIVNSTVTNLNLSAIHISCEVILLVLVAASYKRLSSVIYEISEQFLRLKASIKANQIPDLNCETV